MTEVDTKGFFTQRHNADILPYLASRPSRLSLKHSTSRPLLEAKTSTVNFYETYASKIKRPTTKRDTMHKALVK